MQVGYVADNFGHHSQIPQILNGFGLDNAVLGRGVTPSSLNGKSEFIWEGADGSKVFTHLMACWYNSAYSFPDDSEKAVTYAKQISAQMGQFASVPHYLGMDGCDHLFARPYLSRIFKDINQALNGELEVRHSTLLEFINSVRENLPSDLKVYKGELREEKEATLVQGTFSAHVEIKARNYRSQVFLERGAEPISVFGWINGGTYDEDFLWKAWRSLLQNHPHDSICGCSINQVHKDMMARFDASDDIARNLILKGLQNTVRGINGSLLPVSEKAVVLFNPSIQARSGSLRLTILYPTTQFVGHVEPPNRIGSSDESRTFEPFRLVDSQGVEVRYQVIRRRDGVKRRTAPLHLPDQRKAVEFDIVLENLNLPPLGHEVLAWQYAPIDAPKGIGAPPMDPRPLKESLISHEPHVLENDLIRAVFKNDGTLDVTDKISGRSILGTHYFEDGGDAGQSYDYVEPKRDVLVRSIGIPARITLLVNGPVFACYKVEMELPVPVCLDGDSRSVHTSAIKITTLISLSSGSRRLEFKTTIESQVDDHRLRVMFPTDLHNATSHCAESAFDVTERAIALPADQIYHSGCWNLKSFVDVSDKKSGVAILNRTAAEYHVQNGPRKEIGITLLRATQAVFGPLWGMEGADIDTFGRGEYSHEYALVMHQGDWISAGIFREADEFNVPIYSEIFPTKALAGLRNPHWSLVTLSDARIMVTTVKKAVANDSIVVRLINPTHDLIETKLQLGQEPQAVQLLNLDETVVQELTTSIDQVLTLKPHQIMTLALSFSHLPIGGGPKGHTFPFTREFVE